MESENHIRESADIIRVWSGKKIILPKQVSWKIFDRDTICSNLLSSRYKVLIYKESAFCYDCSLRLAEWKRLMSEIDNSKVSFLFFINTYNENEIEDILKYHEFNYPVIIDKDNTINKLNDFPKEYKLQCFLLNRRNKVLLVGDPTLNNSLWDLYKKVMAN